MLYKYAVKRINMQYFSYICIGIGWSSYQLIRLTQWAFPFFLITEVTFKITEDG